MTTLAARLTREVTSVRRTGWKQRLVAIDAALAANVVTLAVARLVTGEFPRATVGGDEQTIGFIPVIVTTLVAGLAAWGLLALLERVTSRAVAIWTVIAVTVFLLSLLGPLGSGVDTSSKIALACLHIGAAACIIPLMRRSAA